MFGELRCRRISYQQRHLQRLVYGCWALDFLLCGRKCLIGPYYSSCSYRLLVNVDLEVDVSLNDVYDDHRSFHSPCHIQYVYKSRLFFVFIFRSFYLPSNVGPSLQTYTLRNQYTRNQLTLRDLSLYLSTHCCNKSSRQLRSATYGFYQ